MSYRINRMAKHAVGYYCATIRAQNRVIEAIDGDLVTHREPTAVGVDRELNAGMAELALYMGGALALLEQERGEGAAQAVQREVEWLAFRRVQDLRRAGAARGWWP